MKTIRIILSIIGVALTTISFGQLVAQSEGSAVFYTVRFNTANNQFEHQLEEFPVRWTSGDEYEAPLAARTYFVPFENFNEEELIVEPWMTEPFAASLDEEELIVEPWMTEPFAASLDEEELIVEPWMTSTWF